MDRAYIETTIISTRVARISRDLILAAQQESTHEWWSKYSTCFELFTSQAVIEEARQGDPEASARRLGALQGIPLLDITPQATALSKALVAEVPLPEKARIEHST